MERFNSFNNIVLWAIDSKKTDIQIYDLQDIISVQEIYDNENTEIIKQDNLDKSNPYWDYIKMKLINVDFKKLKDINYETKCWIIVNGTNINYPVVQGSDNEYYLTHSFNKSYNKAGWVFLDYRNKLVNDKNTIIYAHGRTDKTMFGSLKNILKSGWTNNNQNYVIKLVTEKESTLWQVFSVYRIPTTSDYLQTDFKSDAEFLNFVSILIKRSNFSFNTTVDSNDKIITLSTCYNDNDKVVLHAKLIKKEIIG